MGQRAIILLYVITYSSSAFTKDDCNLTNRSFLGTKTPYRFIANETFGKITYEGCTPIKAWMTIRHGTRNPSAANIVQINNRLPDIRDHILKNIKESTEYIRNSDLAAFKKWSFKVEEKEEKRLVPEGKDELIAIAERMQSRFPTVFRNVYSNTSYRFKYTYSQRTKKSAKAFATGLFGKATAKDVWFPEPEKKDPILRFYKLCSKWIKTKKSNITQRHRIEFEKSSVMKKLIKDINKRLHYDDELTFVDVETMYRTCGFETAWKKGYRSPWCSVFSTENLKVMQFHEDIKYYWQDGYGHELTYKAACPIFGDMYRFMTQTTDFPKVTTYFTHSGTMLKLLAHLGLYKEEEPHLTSEQFDKKIEERNWRVDKIDAFGSNVAFIKFDCNNIPKILTMHQEKIIRLPACPDNDLCEITNIGTHYKESIEQCDFDNMCENKGRQEEEDDS